MGCPFSWREYVVLWFATLVGYHIDIIRAQAIEKRGNDMLYTLKKGEYPEGHRYWSNATADLTAPDGRDIGPEELPVQGGVLPCRVGWAVLRPALRHV